MLQPEELKIGSANLTDDGLQELAAVKTLKRLCLSGVKTVTATGIDRLRQSCPDLVIELK